MVDPIHPGEILLDDFMKPLGIGMNRLARDLDVPPNRIGAIISSRLRSRQTCETAFVRAQPARRRPNCAQRADGASGVIEMAQWLRLMSLDVPPAAGT